MQNQTQNPQWSVSPCPSLPGNPLRKKVKMNELNRNPRYPKTTVPHRPLILLRRGRKLVMRMGFGRFFCFRTFTRFAPLHWRATGRRAIYSIKLFTVHCFWLRRLFVPCEALAACSQPTTQRDTQLCEKMARPFRRGLCLCFLVPAF